jgi:predicted dehydrogenase
MSHITRRDFLRYSLAAGTSALVCGRSTSGQVRGANDRLRIAVAGLNGRGEAHIRGWLGQPNVEIAYLIDPDQQVLAAKLEGLEKEVQGRSTCKGVADVRRALDDRNLDALSIATPNHWHSLMTIWAAQAGKHV